MTSELIGTWDLESSENFDEYMKELGVGFVMRKTANTLKPTVIITNNGKEWTIISNTSFKSSETKFVEGVEFDETTMDGRKTKSTIKAETPNKLVQEQIDAQSGKLQSTIIREVIAGKLITTLIAGTVECKRIYKRTDK